MKDKAVTFLGLIQKAGKIVRGSDAVEEAIVSGNAELIVISEDAGRNTVKKFTRLCNDKITDIVTIGTKEELGRALGRVPVAVLAITDRGLANALTEKFK